jgi:hypothetical protein
MRATSEYATRAKIPRVRPLLLTTLTPISRSCAPANSAHVQLANGIEVRQFKVDSERLRLTFAMIARTRLAIRTANETFVRLKQSLIEKTMHTATPDNNTRSRRAKFSGETHLMQVQ